MVRQNSPLMLKYATNYERPPQHTIKPSYKLSTRLASKSPYINRPLLRPGRKFTARLAPIHELPFEEDEDCGRSRQELHRDLDAYARSDERDDRRGESEDEAMLDWEDEETLVAMLHDDTSHEPEQDVMFIVENLQAPMSAANTILKQNLKDTLLPVVKRVQEVHGEIENKVDLAYGTGILSFDDVCKKIERIALHDEDEMKTAYSQSQKTLKQLLTQLQEAFTRRDELWTSYEQRLGQRVDSVAEFLKESPSSLEQTIAQLEKKLKTMGKESNSAASRQKMFKGLLDKIV